MEVILQHVQNIWQNFGYLSNLHTGYFTSSLRQPFYFIITADILIELYMYLYYNGQYANLYLESTVRSHIFELYMFIGPVSVRRNILYFWKLFAVLF